ncbi:hypothetical protein GWO43_09040, partial [candidate division KSB1 bacterium]|nr:hypothetical protein [candidate division KSB1 bacterium]NIR73096.1 hypothetical protein [candidate division KSB1 bacterium]NIS24105.1 hypothetical protein [candidate division KSB1 bacterium]NIT71025.1 hypothetical protein [candidate division KSB1 bacterium]NIU24725.1 hypothetical protein [candidate division KSB1 bacterium]
MATKKRSKVTAEPVLQNWDDVKAKFKELVWLDLQVEKISDEQTEAINKLKEKFEEKSESLVARKIRLEKDIEEFCEFHMEQFDKGRTKDFGFGQIGFRKSTPLK